VTRSKLEQYLGILEVLVARPLELEIIRYQVDQDWPRIREHLDSLIARGLVEKLPLGEKRVVYTITDRGLAVLNGLKGEKYLKEHEHLLLVYEE
jgi:predicted transcriptional regulator